MDQNQNSNQTPVTDVNTPVQPVSDVPGVGTPQVPGQNVPTPGADLPVPGQGIPTPEVNNVPEPGVPPAGEVPGVPQAPVQEPVPQAPVQEPAVPPVSQTPPVGDLNQPGVVTPGTGDVQNPTV